MALSPLNQQRTKAAGPTKLTSLALPMMFNNASWKVTGHKMVFRPGGSSLDNIRCRGKGRTSTAMEAPSLEDKAFVPSRSYRFAAASRLRVICPKLVMPPD